MEVCNYFIFRHIVNVICWSETIYTELRSFKREWAYKHTETKNTRRNYLLIPFSSD